MQPPTSGIASHSLSAVCVLVVMHLAGCAANSASSVEPKATVSQPTLSPQPGDTVLYVDGLTCPFCTYNVERQVRKVPGVKDVSVDLATGRVLVTPIVGQQPADSDLAAAIKESGFTIRKSERM